MHKLIITLILLLSISSLLFSQNENKKFASYVLSNPQQNSHLLLKQFNKKEILVFKDTIKEKHVVLTNGYAQYRIKDKQKWDSYNDEKTPYKVDIVFTKYPRLRKDWITNYYSLLANRLKELFSIDSTLNRNNIEFNIVMQVNCFSAAETKKMYHGIVIYYKDKSEIAVNEALSDGYRYLYSEKRRKNLPPLLKNLKINDSIATDEMIAYQIIDQMGLVDKINTADVYDVLERHQNWNNIVIVMDWTGSMYAYSGQIILWHSLNFKISRVDKFVFFNDGNHKKSWDKEIGSTGGIYDFEADSLHEVIEAMYEITQNGRGGDSPENDIEALIYAQNKWPDVKELFLIADNNSSIRDLRLMDQINVPVHVILCRPGFKQHLHYINLAYKTGGTIHNINEDVETFDELEKNGKMKIFGYIWYLRDGNISGVFDDTYKNKLE
jgi:hypothetical protein